MIEELFFGASNSEAASATGTVKASETVARERLNSNSFFFINSPHS